MPPAKKIIVKVKKQRKYSLTDSDNESATSSDHKQVAVVVVTSDSLSAGTIGTDSDKLEEIERRQRFPVQFQYNPDNSKLRIISSAWRFDTALDGNDQGDHVIAYILLLQTFFHLEGITIRQAPEVFYNKILKPLLPDHKTEFRKLAETTRKEVKELKLRRETLVKDKALDDKANKTLKIAEYLKIINHIQEVAEKFINIYNALPNEAFPNTRKSGTIDLIKEGMKDLVEKNIILKDKKFKVLKGYILQAVSLLPNTTDPSLKQAAKSIIDQLVDKDKIPTFLLGANGNITQQALVEFLSSITPLKKQSESTAIQNLEMISTKLDPEGSDYNPDQIDSKKVGIYCAMLFDYPKVGGFYDKNNTQPRDNINILLEAIPRHIITIFTAFKNLENLSKKDKDTIFDTFLDQILDKQLWKFENVKADNGKIVKLNKQIMKQAISEIAILDFKDTKDELRMLSSEEKQLKQQLKNQVETKEKPPSPKVLQPNITKAQAAKHK